MWHHSINPIKMIKSFAFSETPVSKFQICFLCYTLECNNMITNGRGAREHKFFDNSAWSHSGWWLLNWIKLTTFEAKKLLFYLLSKSIEGCFWLLISWNTAWKLLGKGSKTRVTENVRDGGVPPFSANFFPLTFCSAAFLWRGEGGTPLFR